MEFDLRFSDKEITAWGGMGLRKRMLDHLGFECALASAGLPQPGSNGGYRPEQLITQFMLSVWVAPIVLSMVKSLDMTQYCLVRFFFHIFSLVAQVAVQAIVARSLF